MSCGWPTRSRGHDNACARQKQIAAAAPAAENVLFSAVPLMRGRDHPCRNVRVVSVLDAHVVRSLFVVNYRLSSRTGMVPGWIEFR